MFPYIYSPNKISKLLLEEDNKASKNVGFHENEKFTMKEQDIERYNRNLAGEILDTKSYIRNDMPGYFHQAGLFGIDSSLS